MMELTGEQQRQVPPDLVRVLDSIADTFIVLDRHWRFVYVNSHALGQAREPLPELLGHTIWERYPELLGTPVESQFRRAIDQQTAVYFEAEGALTGRWLEIHAYPSPGGLTVYARDVSDRRQAEEALRDSEERHRLIAELTSDYVYDLHFATDGSNRLAFATQGFTRVTGYTVEELERLGGWKVFIHPDDLPRTLAALPRRMSGGPEVDEIRIRTKGGQTRWIRFSTHAIRNPDGRPVRMLGAVQDITERRHAEELLRESQERFQAFMDNGPALTWVKDEAGRFVYVNRPYEQRFGRKREELLGRGMSQIWPADLARRFDETHRAVLAAGRVLESIDEIPEPSGGTSFWRTFRFPFRDASGTQYAGGISVEITEQKQAEERLQESSRRLQALSAHLMHVQEQERRHLARELHDEVGQVLTGLRFALDTAGRLPAAQLPAALGEAQALVRELAGKVRDLSLRLRPSMLDDLGLLPTLLWHLERYTAQTGVRVAFEHHGLGQRLAPAVETAAYRIVQEALTNVARHAGVAHCAVAARFEDGGLHLAVADEGGGFDPACRQRDGTGGGLSGMRERAVLVGGQLEVHSQPAGGTRVTAYLPAGAWPGPAAGGA
jgi:PAS domain S-box-containing protein